MAVLQTKPKAAPPKSEAAINLADRPEGGEKRGRGRPKGEPRPVFSTRLKAETIADVESLKVGLRLHMQGEVVERAVAHYRAHIIEKTRLKLQIASEGDDEQVLAKAFAADY